VPDGAHARRPWHFSAAVSVRGGARARLSTIPVYVAFDGDPGGMGKGGDSLFI
jgi:hypothetical protein